MVSAAWNPERETPHGLVAIVHGCLSLRLFPPKESVYVNFGVSRHVFYLHDKAKQPRPKLRNLQMKLSKFL